MDTSGTKTNMNQYLPQSMLVTGGAGFIGANFVRHVLANEPDTKIINLDKLTYAGSLEHLKNLPNSQNYHFIQGDITDDKLVKHLLMHHHIDTIVHFAAESHVDRSIANPRAFVETNVMGTYVLLEAARHHWFDIERCDATQRRFHHISTDEVFGSLKLNEPSFNEKTPYFPRSPYAASKASSDHFVNAYFHTYGLPITISNCSNNYGPYQHAEKFIPTIIRSCLSNKSIPIYGNGKNIRDWLYVEDHCRGIMSILKQGKIGESYNLGGNNEWDNLSLARYICQRLDALKPSDKPYENLLKFITDRPGHDFRYAIDTKKIKKELNWQPQETFETGIEKTLQYYLNHCE